jgi:hypothetical protein
MNDFNVGLRKDGTVQKMPVRLDYDDNGELVGIEIVGAMYVGVQQSAEFQAGDVYNLGGALGIFWPDVHPCKPYRSQWVILNADGGIGISYDDKPRDDMTTAHRIGTIPGITNG